MLRQTLLRADKTRRPMKAYRYGYQPDPRKLAPRRSMHQKELFPDVVRPPTKAIPTVAAFCETLDVNRYLPMAEHAAAFSDWNQLMNPKRQALIDKGVPAKAIRRINNAIDDYKNGVPMDLEDAKPAQAYWAQFPLKGHALKIPDLPEKYRPHQLGEEQRAAKNYTQLNQMPQWARDEEARLAGKAANK
jgi:hypothetical protein